MKEILMDGSKYVLSLKPGEEVIGELKEFCRVNDIKAGYFWVIGAVEKVSLAWYDLSGKEYVTKTIEENLEIASVTGNIAMMSDEIIIHAHGVFSDKEMQTVAGHVNKMIISGAGEVLMMKLEGKIEREFSEELGLNLMKWVSFSP